MDQRQAVGRTGEALAVNYLADHGYSIIEQNYRCPLGEMDIIAVEGRVTVFVEVRTKTGTAYGSAEESVTPVKLRRLRKLVQYYLQQSRLSETQCRLDLIAIKLDRNTLRLQSLNHIKAI